MAGTGWENYEGWDTADKEAKAEKAGPPQPVDATADYYPTSQGNAFTPGNVAAPADYTNANGVYDPTLFQNAVVDQLSPPPITGDFDRSQPGVMENFDASELLTRGPGGQAALDSIPSIVAPGQGQDWQAQFGPQLAGNMGADNTSFQAYQNFEANRPDISQDAGLDPYYDNARRKTREALAMSSGAAGGYGSSTFQDVNQEAMVNLGAEQARMEADYNLRRIGEERLWSGMGLEGANMASQNQLGWATQLGGLAMNAEEMDLARGVKGAEVGIAADRARAEEILTGGTIARNQQEARGDRIEGIQEKTFQLGNAAAIMAGKAYGEMTAQDLAIIEYEFGLRAGELSEKGGEEKYNNIALVQGASDFGDSVGGAKGGGGGGGPSLTVNVGGS